jgi:signal transduction histidine kinase
MIMKMQTRYLKRLGAWVTDLTDKYRFNPFTQATVHILTIQVFLAILLIAITGWAIQYSQSNTVGSIRQHIQITGHSGLISTSSESGLPQEINNVRNKTLTYVFVGMVILIALFSYLLIQFALAPTKDSLQFQKRFIGNVAHEIRTPLAIIKTSTEVSLMDPNVSAELRETLEDTIHELDRISETINNLLSFDTLIRPERMRFEPVNLALIADQVMARHSSLARSRGIALHVTKDGTHHTIKGNVVAIEEVVTNLVKNAINYTPAHNDGKVTVYVATEFGDHVSIAVADTGIGIAQKDLIHIFEPFYRGDTSRARGIGTGTSGLGLAIVNEIVRLHHGSTTVRSAPGQGTTIKISFPRADDTENSDVIDTNSDNSTEEVSVDFS